MTHQMSTFQTIFFVLGVAYFSVIVRAVFRFLRDDLPVIRKNLREDRQTRKSIEHLKSIGKWQ